jgi:ABC-type transport system involved in multi-copper enzyme maturation permease subunit
MAKSLADLPSIIIFPLIYSTLLYIITHQTGEMWRFYAHLSIITLFSLLSHSLGLLISAFFINKMNAALISFAVIFFPLLLFSGFLIPIKELPKILQYFSYLSIFRLSLESLILVIYGFNRCEKMMDKITVQQMKSELGVDLLQIDECFSYSDSLPNITQGFNKMNNHLMHRNPSQVLEFFLLEDNSLYINIILMIIYTILLRVLAYYVLKWRTKVN